MKIYLVDMDNGESYEDYRHWIAKVFTDYRKAAEWLVEIGYEPRYLYKWTGSEYGHDVEYYCQESEGYMAECSWARILEMELEK